MEYLVCDWKTKGNLVRFYYCAADDYDKVWGDDWDDKPYEHNAGMVYDRYVKGYIDMCFNFDIVLLEAENDWSYRGNSPFSKEDFKNKLAPILIAYKPPENDWWDGSEYHQLLGAENSNQILKFYMGTEIHTLPLINREAVVWWNQVIKE